MQKPDDGQSKEELHGVTGRTAPRPQERQGVRGRGVMRAVGNRTETVSRIVQQALGFGLWARQLTAGGLKDTA